MARFLGRTILITGAGSGLGQETANLLSREGARVIAVDLRFSDALHDDAERHTADVRDAHRLFEIARHVRESHGGVDGLATFAGVEMPGGIADISSADWMRVLEINVIGSANAVRSVMPDLERSGRGAILLCSSQLSLAGGRDCVAYAASKGAINAMCRSLALDHAARGVRVNAVAPGATETPMMERAFANVSLDDQQRSRARHPLGRFGRPRETATAAAFLLSEEAAFITGAVLPVDGGWSAG